MKEFVLEIGRDFIPMGEEYRLQVGMSDFRVDLLFFIGSCNALSLLS